MHILELPGDIQKVIFVNELISKSLCTQTKQLCTDSKYYYEDIITPELYVWYKSSMCIRDYYRHVIKTNDIMMFKYFIEIDIYSLYQFQENTNDHMLEVIYDIGQYSNIYMLHSIMVNKCHDISLQVCLYQFVCGCMMNSCDHFIDAINWAASSYDYSFKSKELRSDICSQYDCVDDLYICAKDAPEGNLVMQYLLTNSYWN